MHEFPVQGTGLGLRRGMFSQMRQQSSLMSRTVDFLELAPENWIGVGGRYGKQFRWFAERYPLVCHGLSLSLGSPDPLDFDLLNRIREFLNTFNVHCYSEHLSACSDHGHLYNLMPIPFTEESVRYVAKRIRNVQDVIERRMAIEHVSYYAAPGQELSESEFINAIVQEADCELLLDVNNAYVNGINFSYDPEAFIDSLPLDRVAYLHIAGHWVEAEDLRIDTHSSAVSEPVWDLLRYTYKEHGVMPTLLERDFRFPPFEELLDEVQRISGLQEEFQESEVTPQPSA